MATNIIMPKQGLQMTEGTIVQWFAAEGDAVKAGEPLFEIETDKLTISIDAACSGTLLRILHPAGDTVPVAEPIAVVGVPGEKAEEPARSEPEEKPAAAEPAEPVQTQPGLAVPANDRVFASPRARLRAEERGIELSGLTATGPDGLLIERDIPMKPERIPATPLARKLAARREIPLDSLRGSGPHGKITRADLPDAEPQAEVQVLPYAGARRIIGEKMLRSLQTQAQLWETIRVDMTEAAALREAFRQQERKISYNDLVLFAVSRALPDFPLLNSRLTERGIELSETVNLGVAAATENGLLVPVLRGAERLRLPELSAAARDLGARAKSNRLRPDECSGGTFTVSNLGMYGIEAFQAILNTPETGILAVGAVQKLPAVDGDAVVIRPVMQLTLTFDHRVVDGAPAARFLHRLKMLLEQPYLML